MVVREMAGRWAPACNEYFDDFLQGWYDEQGQLQFILPAEKLTIEPERGDLVIGHAGVDGIYFCFRENMTGVYAYYGIDDVHVPVAPSIQALVSGWVNGSITV